MALTLIESLVLWGVPVLTILVTVGYYLYWGKEAEEREPGDTDTTVERGGS